MARGRFDTIIRGRINWVLLFFCVALIILVVKIFIMQVLRHREYLGLAAKQHRLVREIFPERGNVFMQDKNGILVPLTLNKIQKNLVAVPREIKDPEGVAEFLAHELNLANKEDIFKKIDKRQDSYEVLAKKLDEKTAVRFEKQKSKGLFLEEEKRRIYPHANLAAHLIGFVSKEEEVEEGRYGLESFYEKELSGKKGIWEGVKDAAGSWIALGKRIINPPKDGVNLTLTVDYNIQLVTEDVLRQVADRWKAASALALVLDPKTGRILAMAATPSFDPNEFSKEKNYQVFVNPLVESMYELGSVIKPITMAAALNEGLIKPDDTYNDQGAVTIGNYNINNADGKIYHIQTMTQVLEKSINTGAVYVSRLLGKEKQLDYFTRFGFGSRTGIDLPGEALGDISNLNSKRDIDFATASFGQGIAVTPIQLASAMAAIANGGQLMKPYVVEKITDSSGNETLLRPELIRRIISSDTAEKLTKMLISVVRNGYNNRAGVKGYFVAGKTGTAQIPKKDRRGYSDEVIHTFVGYAPAFNPNFLILLQLNKPQAKFAAATMPSYFQELASFILNYYEVPPDEK